MNVLLDMNLSPAWVQFLRDAGFHCVHWSSIGDPRAADVALMTWARDNGYVVFTHDLDFGALLATTKASGPSVLQVRTEDTSPSAIGPDVVRVLRLRGEILARGALITIDKARARVRVLPIGVGSDPSDKPV